MTSRTVTRWTTLIMIASMILAGFGPVAGAQASSAPPEPNAPTAADAHPQSSAPEITASAVVVRSGDPVVLTLKNGRPGNKGYFRDEYGFVEFFCAGNWRPRCEQQIDPRGSDLTIQARRVIHPKELDDTYDELFNFYDTTKGELLPAGVWVRFYRFSPPNPPPSAQPEIVRHLSSLFPFGGFYLESIKVDGRLYVCADLKNQQGYVEVRLNGVPALRQEGSGVFCPIFDLNMGDLQHTGSGVRDKPVNGQYVVEVTAYNPSGRSTTETGSYIQVPFKAEWFKEMVWLQPVAFRGGENPSYDLDVTLPLKGYNFGAPSFIRNNGSAETKAGYTFKGTLSFPVKCRENYEISADANVDAFASTVYVVQLEGSVHGNSRLSLNFRGCQLLGAQLKGSLYAGGEADGGKEWRLWDILIDFMLDPGWLNEFLKWLGSSWTDPSVSIGGKLTLQPGLDASATLSPIPPYLTSSARSKSLLQLGSRYNHTWYESTVEVVFELGGVGGAEFNKDGLAAVDNLLFTAFVGYQGKMQGRLFNIWMTKGFGGKCQYPPYAPNESCRKQSAVAAATADSYALIPHPAADAYAVFTESSLSDAWAAPDVAALHPITGVLVSNIFTYTTNALAIDPASGQALLVWDYDDLARPVGESMELRFSRGDGANWRAPAAITDDALQDMAPQVAWTTGGQAVAVWSRWQQLASAASMADEDFLNAVEIASATYDAATDTWSAPAPLTANQLADFAPTLARNPNGRLLAAWNQFTAVSGLQTDGPSNVMAAFYDGGWGAPGVVVTDVAQLSEVAAGYGDGRATIAFSRAVTPTGTVTPTRQIWTTAWDGIAWAAPQRLTDDHLDHMYLNLLYNAQNEPLLVWFAGDALQLRNLVSGATASYPLGDGFGIQDELYAVQDRQGNIVAVFRDQVGHPDLYVAYYDRVHGVWGHPRPLTADEALERSLSPAFDATGRLQVAYGSTASHNEDVPVQVAAGETLTLTMPTAGQTDLSLLRYTFDRNLTVMTDSLAISDAAPIPGSVVMVSGTVVNTGDLPLEGVTLTFYDGDPAVDGVFIGTAAAPVVLPAGASATVTVPYLALAEGGIRTFYALADAANLVAEVDEGDNRGHLRAFGSDLEIVETWADLDALGRTFLAAAVHNRGTTTTPPTTVQFHREAITGTAVTTATVPAISPSAVYTAVVLWDHSALPTGDVHLLVTVNEGDFEELNRVNNAAGLPVAVGPDLALSPYALEVGNLAAASVPVTLTLRNIGAVTATDVALVFHNGWALDDTTRLITHTVASLAGGGATRITAMLPGPLTCGLYIQVDNQVGRDMEWGNNVISLPGAAWCANRLYLPIVYRSTE